MLTTVSLAIAVATVVVTLMLQHDIATKNSAAFGHHLGMPPAHSW